MKVLISFIVLLIVVYNEKIERVYSLSRSSILRANTNNKWFIKQQFIPVSGQSHLLPDPGVSGDKKELGPCGACRWIMDKFKYNLENDYGNRRWREVYPYHCNRLWNEMPGLKKDQAYSQCHMAFDAIKVNQPLVRSLFANGCFVYFDNSHVGKAWLKPCPDFEICSMIHDLNHQQFCTSSKEYNAPNHESWMCQYGKC